MGFFSSIVDSVQDAVEDVQSAVGVDESGNSKLDAKLNEVFDDLGVDKVIDGIKEALSVAIGRAVEMTGKRGGFLTNELIKIGLPPKVKKFGDALRSAGLGSIVDDFEEAMNKAAEDSAPLAADVFMKTIREMTVDDAKGIWRGDDKSAATSYLKRSCSPELTANFTPRVAEVMDQTSLTRIFGELQEKLAPIPFIGDILDDFNLEEYTVAQALDGIFLVMAQQETKVREDPSSVASSIIQTVFSRQAFNVEVDE